MSAQVKSFDDKELKEAVKQSPKIVQEYIAAQKRALENWSYIFAEQNKALTKKDEILKKIKEACTLQ
jgi:hypothetical protein